MPNLLLAAIVVCMLACVFWVTTTELLGLVEDVWFYARGTAPHWIVLARTWFERYSPINRMVMRPFRSWFR